MPCAGILRGAKQPRVFSSGVSEETRGRRRGERGRAPRFEGEGLEVRVAGAVVWVDGRRAALGTAEPGSSGQDWPRQLAGVRFFSRAPLRCGRPPSRRQSRRLLWGWGSGGEEEDALSPVQPPSELRHRQFPAREVPDLQGFASKLLEIPAVSL